MQKPGIIQGESILTSEEKYKIISGNLAEGVIIINETGGIEEWNGYMEEKTNYTKSEIYSKKIWDIQYSLLTKEWKEKYPVESLHKLWINLILNLKVNEFIAREGQFIGRNNELILTEDIVCRVRSNGKDYLYVIQRERSKSRNVDHRDILISIITNELRSLIANIVDMSKLINKDERRIDLTKIANFVKEVISSSENAITSLDNLLIWLKNQNSNLSFIPKNNNLNFIVKEIINEYYSLSSRKNVHIKYSPSAEIFCYADEDMLKTIIRNLVHNSIKFTNPGGNIKIRCIQKQKEIKITVTDNGTGIDEETKQKLFRIDSAKILNGIEGEEPSELGLSLCKTFVERHSGKIRINSKPGKGTEFCISLPSPHNS